VLCRPQNYRASNPQHSLLHEAVTIGWPEVQREASAEGNGFPQRVHDEMQGYLNCGDPRHGFVEVRCEECEASVAVPFSCKRRGFCPKCAAKRAHETESHLMGILPQVSYRHYAEIAIMWSSRIGPRGNERFLLNIRMTMDTVGFS